MRRFNPQRDFGDNASEKKKVQKESDVFFFPGYSILPIESKSCSLIKGSRNSNGDCPTVTIGGLNAIPSEIGVTRGSCATRMKGELHGGRMLLPELGGCTEVLHKPIQIGLCKPYTEGFYDAPRGFMHRNIHTYAHFSISPTDMGVFMKLP